MRIFARKALVFEHQGATFRTEHMAFADMPDHFRNSLLFSWALRDGDIEVIGGGERQKAVEREPGKPAVKRQKATPEPEDI